MDLFKEFGEFNLIRDNLLLMYSKKCIVIRIILVVNFVLGIYSDFLELKLSELQLL